MSRFKLYFLETRPQFLLLTPAAFSVGIAVAVFKGQFNGVHLIVALIGSVLAHITVNVLNDHFDYVKGTDKLTKRTPFSGGSGFLPEGMLKSKEALWLGLSSLIAGLAIGAYFVLKYPVLLYIVALAAILTVIYTPILTRIYITELFPGIGFGPLLIIGAYITQLSSKNPKIAPEVIWASIPVGILVSNLLWVNEIPDYEADLQTGRRHGVILVGKRAASYIYALLIGLSYLFIVLPVSLGILPPYVLLGLLTIPIGLKAIQGVVKNYGQVEQLIPALGQNVLVVLVTPLLMTVGLILAKFI